MATFETEKAPLDLSHAHQNIFIVVWPPVPTHANLSPSQLAMEKLLNPAQILQANTLNKKITVKVNCCSIFLTTIEIKFLDRCNMVTI